MKRSHTIYITILFALSFIGVVWASVERGDIPEPESLAAKKAVPIPEEVLPVATPVPAPEPVVLPRAEEENVPVSVAALSVPFTSQAPSAKWSDDTFQNGCEEASLVMAAYWISGKPLAKDVAEREIVALSAFEKKHLSHAVDTSAADTAELFRDYYGAALPEVRYDISALDIRGALRDGAAVIVPTNGRKLGNPNFKTPGPLTHMLVVIGYDGATEEFIVNDPGTRLGKGYRYSEKVLLGAIRDYPTGKHLSISSETKAMIVVRKP